MTPSNYLGRAETQECRRQAQQSQRVTGGSGVEHDMVVCTERSRVGEEPRKRVEGSDFDGAGTCELLLQRGDLGFGQHAAVRADDACPVVVGGLVRVEVHDLEPGTPGTAVGCSPVVISNTSLRFDAGSVDTSSTRRRASASATAAAEAMVVLPTPPLPVNNTKRVDHPSQSSGVT